MLEPLAVLSLPLGGQKVSLGFFTIIIFGMCACAVCDYEKGRKDLALESGDERFVMKRNS